jgi:hypothetical protein
VGKLRLGSSISMLEGGQRKWLGAAGFSSGAGGEKKNLTCGAHTSVTV